MCDEGQSLPGERFTSLPQTMPSIHFFSSVLRCCVVKHLRRRFEPPGTPPPKKHESFYKDVAEMITQEVKSEAEGGAVPFTRLPQTLEVLPCFPARFRRRRGGLLRWEVRTVVACCCRLRGGSWGRGGSRLERRHAFRNKDDGQTASSDTGVRSGLGPICWLRCNPGLSLGKGCSLSCFAVGGGYQ